MVGVEVLVPQQKGREALRRDDGARDAPRVHLAALDLVQHRDVDVLGRRRPREERAPAHEAALGEALERALGVGSF